MSLKLYLITCDLVEDGDHRSFRERLRALEARQVLNEQWAVRSNYTAVELKNLLKQFLGDRDRIVIAEIGEERASRRAMADLYAQLMAWQQPCGKGAFLSAWLLYPSACTRRRAGNERNSTKSIALVIAQFSVGPILLQGVLI